MFDKIGKFVRTLTRPVTTLVLIGAVVALAFKGSIEGDSVVTLATAAVAFWFASRQDSSK